jgi:V/A-type H+-transporting ATPase subunit I
MQKVAVFFPRNERDRILEVLQDRGSVEILDLKETPLAGEVEVGEPGVAEADRTAADIRRAIEDLSAYEEKGGILSGFGGGKVVVTKEDFETISADFDYGGVLEEVEQLEVRRAELRSRRSHLNGFIERMEPWAPLDVPVEEIGPRKDARMVAGLLSAGRSPESLEEELAGASDTFSMEIVNRTDRQANVVVFYHRSEEEQIQEIMRRHDLEIQAFENLEGLPGELLEDARRELAEVDRTMADLDTQGAGLVRHKPRLKIAHDYFAQEARKADACGLVGTTRQVGMVEGWVRKQDYARLARDVEGNVDAAEVLEIEPDAGEKPPVELKNRSWMRPFEVITELYGMPHSREVDPTPLAGPFFALFFGICLTDAGYGIVLAALALALMKYLKTGHKLLWLIFAGGLTTIVMGALAGGWFGIVLPPEGAASGAMPAFLGSLVRLAQAFRQIDPLAEPMTFFGIALALGFIQVIFGLVVEMIENFKAGDFAAGVFDQLTWIILLCSLLIYGAGSRVPALTAYVPAGKWAAIGAAVAIVGFTHREGGPVARIGWGVYNLYGVTGFLGDVLSYARLMALGLATAGIAMVINSVAVMTKGIPVVGYPAMIIVLIAGHTLNIAVNALGAFVHSARLQYVEFYPKFFEGGGKRFRPFARELKYTTLAEKAG